MPVFGWGDQSVMPEKELPPDAQRYAEEARGLRAVAITVTEIEVRDELLRVADLYEKLAQLVEESALHTLSAAALVATQGLPSPHKESPQDADHRV
jgi:hypothetical protein